MKNKCRYNINNIEICKYFLSIKYFLYTFRYIRAMFFDIHRDKNSLFSKYLILIYLLSYLFLHNLTISYKIEVILHLRTYISVNIYVRI